MQLTREQRAEILIQALPYIQKYNDKIVVVKYGGNAMINDDLKEAVMGDIVLLSLIGVKVVLIQQLYSHTSTMDSGLIIRTL